ncbi:hypothetical protein MBANPS3_012553, partial [Mucor bainieri]
MNTLSHDDYYEGFIMNIVDRNQRVTFHVMTNDTANNMTKFEVFSYFNRLIQTFEKQALVNKVQRNHHYLSFQIYINQHFTSKEDMQQYKMDLKGKFFNNRGAVDRMFLCARSMKSLVDILGTSAVCCPYLVNTVLLGEASEPVFTKYKNMLVKNKNKILNLFSQVPSRHMRPYSRPLVSAQSSTQKAIASSDSTASSTNITNSRVDSNDESLLNENQDTQRSSALASSEVLLIICSTN